MWDVKKCLQLMKSVTEKLSKISNDLLIFHGEEKVVTLC